MLPTDNWHVVIYAYMGVYPESNHGAYALLRQAAELTVTTGSERIIVKTVAESRRIPTIAENVQALEFASDSAASTRPIPGTGADSQTHQEASALVAAVLNLDPDSGALPIAHLVEAGRSCPFTSWDLLVDLSYVRRKFDEAPPEPRELTARQPTRWTRAL